MDSGNVLMPPEEELTGAGGWLSKEQSGPRLITALQL